MEEEEFVELGVSRRLAEGGTLYEAGDPFDMHVVEYDRLVYLMAKEIVMPVHGWNSLPEPLRSDVAELRH